MKAPYKINASVLMLATLTACTGLKYTRWYRSVEYVQDSTYIQQHVQVSARVLDIDPAAPKRIYDLSDQGQAAYIAAHDRTRKNDESIAERIAKPIAGAAERSVDLTTVKKRIILSVQHNHEQKADRLDYLAIQMTIDSTKAYFVSWDKLETKYGTVDLGKLTAGSSSTFSFSPELSMSGDLIGTSAGSIGGGRTTSEELTNSRRFIELSGVLLDGKATLILQGAPGRDLDGNIAVEVTIATKEKLHNSIHSNGPLFQPAGPGVADTLVTMVETKLTEPAFTVPLVAKLSFKAKLRQVTNPKAKTIPEGDDKVRLISGVQADAGTITLAKTTELRKRRWLLTDGSLNVNLRVNPNTTELAFASPREAADFLAWLKQWTPRPTEKGKPPQTEPKFKGFELVDQNSGKIDPGKYGGLYVKELHGKE